MNSNKHFHNYTFKKSSNTMETYNFKNWHGSNSLNITQIKGTKKLKTKNFSEDINYLTGISYAKLIKGINLKKNSFFIKPIINAHKLCIDVNRKIKKHDFKKM